MKIAIPTKNEKSCSNLYLCESVTVFNVINNRIESEMHIDLPCQETDSYDWLTDLKIDMVITGTIDSNFNDHLIKYKVKAITGAPIASPQMLAEFYAM